MKKSVSKTEKKNDAWCPYCEDEIANSQLPFCQPCKLETFNCPQCGKATPRNNKICPNCGAPMKPKST